MSGFLKNLEVAGRRLLFKAASPGVSAGERLDSLSESYVPGRIMIMRQDRIGDMVMTLPLLRRLRQLYPDSRIAVVCSESNRIVLKYEGDFHIIIHRKSPLGLLRSLGRAMAFGPDCAVDMHMHDSTTSFIYAVCSGAPWKLHVNRNNRLPFSVRVNIPEGVHIMEAFAGLLGGLGQAIETEDLDMEISLSRTETDFAEDFWRRKDFLRKDTVAVNISAGDERRWWGTENYRDLCRRVHSIGLIPLLLSAPDHTERVRGICESDCGAVAAPATLTVLHMAALMSGVRLLVSPDTSAVHIAASFGIPVVGMYLPSDPELPGWSPWKVRSEILTSEGTGSLDSITSDAVMSSLVRILEGKGFQ